jgi:hypothetical protein
MKITILSLSYMQQAPRQVKHIKFYQNYYPKFEINRGVGVLTVQILTTHINVSQMECTCAYTL